MNGKIITANRTKYLRPRNFLFAARYMKYVLDSYSTFLSVQPSEKIVRGSREVPGAFYKIQFYHGKLPRGDLKQ